MDPTGGARLSATEMERGAVGIEKRKTGWERRIGPVGQGKTGRLEVFWAAEKEKKEGERDLG